MPDVPVTKLPPEYWKDNGDGTHTLKKAFSYKMDGRHHEVQAGVTRELDEALELEAQRPKTKAEEPAATPPNPFTNKPSAAQAPTTGDE